MATGAARWVPFTPREKLGTISSHLEGSQTVSGLEASQIMPGYLEAAKTVSGQLQSGDLAISRQLARARTKLVRPSALVPEALLGLQALPVMVVGSSTVMGMVTSTVLKTTAWCPGSIPKQSRLTRGLTRAASGKPTQKMDLT